MIGDTDAARAGSNHLPVLDGVRALSILLVLATHWLPLNKLWWEAGTSVGMLGMACFFVLSGYLITLQLLRWGSALSFAVQRLARVLPLAWLCAVIVALLLPMDGRTLLSHVLFYANLPPQTLTHPLDHYWSLCVELQFYAVAAALLMLRPAFTGWVILTLLLAVTTFRLITNSTSGSVTWVRADDILAGAVLAWSLRAAPWRQRVRDFLGRPALLWASGALFCASCVLLERGNELNYLRSYAAAGWVGALICQPTSCASRVFAHHRWRYLAAVSYAVYVLHLPLTATWLGSGELMEKYLKRPLLVVVVFALAHLSTFHFERHFIAWGRRFGTRRNALVRPVA